MTLSSIVKFLERKTGFNGPNKQKQVIVSLKTNIIVREVLLTHVLNSTMVPLHKKITIIACFFQQTFTCGTLLNLGMLTNYFLEEFHVTNAQVSLIMSLSVSLFYGAGIKLIFLRLLVKFMQPSHTKYLFIRWK